MKTLIEVLISRKNTFVLNTANLELISTPNFIGALSVRESEVEVVTDKDGGILTDTHRFYHLAMNPMISTEDITDQLYKAQ